MPLTGAPAVRRDGPDPALDLVAEFSRSASPGSVLRCVARCRRQVGLTVRPVRRADLTAAAVDLARDRLTTRSTGRPAAGGPPAAASRDAVASGGDGTPTRGTPTPRDRRSRRAGG